MIGTHFTRKGHHFKTGLMGGKGRPMNGWRAGTGSLLHFHGLNR